jgi:hypothetical protein
MALFGERVKALVTTETPRSSWPRCCDPTGLSLRRGTAPDTCVMSLAQCGIDFRPGATRWLPRARRSACSSPAPGAWPRAFSLERLRLPRQRLIADQASRSLSSRSSMPRPEAVSGAGRVRHRRYRDHRRLLRARVVPRRGALRIATTGIRYESEAERPAPATPRSRRYKRRLITDRTSGFGLRDWISRSPYRSGGVEGTH